jgi:hypothetical protein
MSIPTELLGTIPGWITSAGVIAILGIVVRWQLGLRKLSIAAQQVDVNAAEVRNKDTQMGAITSPKRWRLCGRTSPASGRASHLRGRMPRHDR